MTSHSDSEPDDDTITIAMNKVVISSVRVGGNCGAARTKQNNNKQDKQTITTKAIDKHEKVSTTAEFGD